MKRAWHIAGKEILQNRRDPLALLFTIVLPVIFTVFLGLLIPSGDEGDTRLPLAVVDEDGTRASQELIDGLADIPLLELKTSSAAAIDSAVQDQKVAAGLIIPDGFGEAADAGRPVALTFIRVETSSGAQSVWEAVEGALSRSNAATLAAEVAAEQVSAETGRPLDQGLLRSALSIAESHLAAPAIGIEVIDAGDSPVARSGGFQQSSTGALVNWVLFGLLGVCSTVVWERKNGLLSRLSAAGVRSSEILGGKTLAMVALTFAQQLLLVLLGQFAFGVDYFSSPLALLFIMISLSLLATAFGLLIASVLRSEQAVVAATVVTALLLAALGGAWFPLEVTSAGFSKIAHVLPSAWIMDAFHGITLKGWGVADILKPIGIVWIWIVAVASVALWRFRPE